MSSTTPPPGSFAEILAATDQAVALFSRQIRPLLARMPGQQSYPPIPIGNVMLSDAWVHFERICREHGYAARRTFEGSTFLVWLTRISGEHERGAGDDFPRSDPCSD